MHFHLEASWLLPSSYIGPPMSPRQCKMAGPIVKMVGLAVRLVRSKALAFGTNCYAEPPAL